MTLHEKIVLSAYTGVLMCDVEYVHAYIEKLLGRPVFTHELGTGEVLDEIKEKSRWDFMDILNAE